MGLFSMLAGHAGQADAERLEREFKQGPRARRGGATGLPSDTRCASLHQQAGVPPIAAAGQCPCAIEARKRERWRLLGKSVILQCIFAGILLVGSMRPARALLDLSRIGSNRTSEEQLTTHHRFGDWLLADVRGRPTCSVTMSMPGEGILGRSLKLELVRESHSGTPSVGSRMMTGICRNAAGSCCVRKALQIGRGC